jgi:hypothetical protein
MPVGDKEAAVVASVNGDLHRRGYNPPYDPSQKMNGVPIYGYQSPIMFMFHRNVKSCLAGKGYSYVYPETNAYVDQTVVMSLADIYAAISVKTTIGAPAVAAAAEVARAKVGVEPAAPKRAKKKAAKRRRVTTKAKPVKKKAAAKKKGARKKTGSAKKAATGAAKKRKAAKRR